MKPFASAFLALPLTLAACATAVTEDLTDGDVVEGGSAGSASGGVAGTATAGGGKSGGKAGNTSNAFGGSATSGGSGGSASGGAAGNTAAGSGGASQGGGGGSTSAAGSGGSSSSGGKAGSGGTAGTGTGGAVGTGSCAGTQAFVAGASTKYAMGAKVVATCNNGTPCTLANPLGQNGKTYEFSCLDMYNCGGQDPATTNWAQPPWQLTATCE